MSYALYEFMPYGAPDLITGAPRRLTRALMTSVIVSVVAFAMILVWQLVRPVRSAVERTIVVQYRELAAPPPLAQVVPPPQVAVARAVAAPAAGVPVPVPEEKAPPQQTIASQEEIAVSRGTGEGAGPGDVIVATPPPAEVLPKLDEYVYSDELPVLVTDVAPVYPTIAKEAVVEGEVLLRVLVGKDGQVLHVHVERSIPMLDDAAVAAAKQWVFKPALAGNRPVAVWIVRRVRFRLQS